jgi:AraC-like DNA-binding protein
LSFKNQQSIKDLLMINPIYFAWMASAGGQQIPQASMFRRLVAAGKISAALAEASQHVAQSTSDKSMASFWARCALDMALLIDCMDEVVKDSQRILLRGQGTDLAFNVLHMAAARAIVKGDVVAAIRNYAGMTHEQFDASQKCEGFAGMALAYLSLADIETASLQVDRLIQAAPEGYGWRGLGSVMQEDIRGIRQWHSQTVLRDHVYWHQNPIDLQTGINKKNESSLGQHDDAECMLSTLRRGQLALRSMTSASLLIQNLHRQYEWGSRELSKFHLVSSRIEQAMIAIAHNRTQLLPQILTCVGPESIMSSSTYSDAQKLELSYCFYKVSRDHGDSVKASEYYRNYLILSVNRTRLGADVGHYCEAQKSQHTYMLSDDVSARLPAKYRRAYQYMLTHLDDADLSIQDIADVIDVSARALQQAFKKHLGESPTEVLRRRRIERVHGALLNISNSTLIMDVAKKYGINNRTTLTSGYRKLYAELPSHTLKLGFVQAPRAL